jgi:hypothetical protein
VDLDVAGGALESAEGWWIRIRLLGSVIRLPVAPPASNSDPIDIAIP